MKKVFFSVFAVLALVTSAFAHTLFMSVTDNEDGTISVNGMYSTGAEASHTDLRLVDGNGKVLFSGKTDEFGEAEITKPDVPYIIILDGGTGHVAEQEGPQ